MALSQEGSHGSGPPIDLPAAGISSQASWPTETELLLLLGSNKVLLTVQCHLCMQFFKMVLREFVQLCYSEMHSLICLQLWR